MKATTFSYIEISLAVLSFLGFLGRSQGILAGTYLFSLGLGLLLVFYLVQVFLPPRLHIVPQPVVQAPVSILSYLGAAFVVTGVWSKLMIWSVAEQWLRIALLVFGGIILLVLFRFRISDQVENIRFYRYILVRSLFLISTAFLFYITPSQKLVDLYESRASKSTEHTVMHWQVAGDSYCTHPHLRSKLSS